MVGAALMRKLTELDYATVTRSRDELDLCCQASVQDFFQQERPDIVIFAAAKVGGIHANDTYSAEFIYQNLMMAANSIHTAHQTGTQRFLFLGSTCIYPRMAPQPMPEDCLLTGELESTNEAYAIAKISGLKLCEHYRKQYGVLFHSAMPTNLYGPGDNYHPENSHVMPALIRRFHEAKENGDPEVMIWGTGTPRREFLHVDDLAEALLHLVQLPDPPNLVNVGTGTDVSIAELATLVARTVGYQGEIKNDLTKEDGTPVKRTNIDLIKSTSWSPKISLEDGLQRTYRDFKNEMNAGALRSA